MSLVSLFALSTLALAQQTGVQTIEKFPLSKTDLRITQPAQPRQPFSLAGPRSAVFGQQDGSIEVWQYPVKILSHLHITAELENYPVPINLTEQAASLEVEPDHTTLVYSHAAITVRQHMFVARDAAAAPVVLFEISSRRKARLTIEFQPDLQRQWPALNTRHPGISFVDLNPGGAYVLSGDAPRFAAMIAMPNATSGIMAPFQERPRYYAPQFILSYDPARDADHYFPMLFALCDGEENPAMRTREMLRKQIESEAAHLPQLYKETSDYYAHFFDHRLTISTPESSLDRATRWAQLSIDQLKVRKQNESAFIAGLVPSGDSDRPGFGWFFGRDSLWTLYALHSTGDFASSRQELDFLIHRQREDGKIMHELSQSADRVDWKSTSYYYAAADATPLFIMVVEDYFRSSGDSKFIAENWSAIERAWRFTRSHTTHGVYDNSQGTGWVEGWSTGMPDQEFYLASLDEQSANSYRNLATLLGKADEAAAAQKAAQKIHAELESYRDKNGLYAFSHDSDNTYDRTPTVFPAVAWWSATPQLQSPEAELRFLATHDLSPDWGSRAVATSADKYDPISYHQGSVWPLFTGWSAMAEYRAHQPLAALSLLHPNADLFTQQDPGHSTELLSGDANEALGRSTAHQLWSAAMLLSPLTRGLFGIAPDAPNATLHLNPQLPADWNHASIAQIPFADAHLDLHYERILDEKDGSAHLLATVTAEKPIKLCLQSDSTKRDCADTPATTHTLRIPLPALELSLSWEALQPGESSHRPRVLRQQYADHSLTIELEALAGSNVTLALHGPAAKSPSLKVEGATLSGESLICTFAKATGFQSKTITLLW